MAGLVNLYFFPGSVINFLMVFVWSKQSVVISLDRVFAVSVLRRICVMKKRLCFVMAYPLGPVINLDLYQNEFKLLSLKTFDFSL